MNMLYYECIQQKTIRLPSAICHATFPLIPSLQACPILQVQPLDLLLSLGLHHIISRTPEIAHLHPHSPLPQSPQPSFGADGFDVGTAEIVLLRDELIEVDVGIEGHLRGVEVEDLALGVFCRLQSVSEAQVKAIEGEGKAYGQGSRTGSCGRYDLGG